MNSKTVWRSALATVAFLVVSVRGELSVPPPTGRVVDRAGILWDVEEKRLAGSIQELERATGGQMAVLTIRSLEGDSLEGFSLRVARSWKIGHQGKDNGALLLVSKEDRKIRLEIGYGWAGKITDAKAANVIRGMGPFLRSKKYAEGVGFAIGEVRRLLIGEQGGRNAALPATTEHGAAASAIGAHSSSHREPAAWDAKTKRLLLVMGAFAGGALLIFLFAWVFPGSGRCCYCGSGKHPVATRSMRRDGSGTVSAADYGRLVAGSGGVGGTSGGTGGGYSGGGGSFGGGGASGGW